MTKVEIEGNISNIQKIVRVSMVDDRYCRGCGLKMAIKKVGLRFSSTNGKVEYGRQSKCPQYRWYRFYLHDKYIDSIQGRYT